MYDLRPEVLDPSFLLEHIRRDTKFDADLLEQIISECKRYKATGLEPEEITKEPQPCVFYCNRKCTLNGDWCAEGPGCQLEMDKDQIAHIRNLLAAEKDGRLVGLPCKVGLRVKVDARTWGNIWNYKTIENGRFLVGEVVSITMTRKQILMKIRVEHNVGWKKPMKRYPVSAIGLTVFPLEAEAALRGEDHGQ